MATYLTINSKFQPYSYEEILKPYQDKQKAYEEKSTEVQAMLDQTATWEGLLDPVKDKELYDKLQDINSRIQKASEQLGRGNLKDVTKADINALKQEYTKAFTPVATKYADWKEKAQKQQDLINQARANGKAVYATKYLTGMSITEMRSDDLTYDIVNMSDSLAKLTALGQSDGNNDIYYNSFKDSQGNPKYGSRAPKTEQEIEQEILSYIPTNLSDADKQDAIERAVEAYSVGYSASQSPENIARIKLQERQQSISEAASYRSNVAFNMERLFENAALNEYAPGVIISRDGNNFLDTNKLDKNGNPTVIHPSEYKAYNIDKYIKASTTKDNKNNTNPNTDPYYDADTKLYYDVIDGKRIYYKNAGRAGEVQVDGTKVYKKDNIWQDYNTKKEYYKDPETSTYQEIISTNRVTKLNNRNNMYNSNTSNIQVINNFMNQNKGIVRLSNGKRAVATDPKTDIDAIKAIDARGKMQTISVDTAKEKWPKRTSEINNLLLKYGLEKDEVVIIYDNSDDKPQNSFYIVLTKVPSEILDAQGKSTKAYIYKNNPAIEEIGITDRIYGENVPEEVGDGGLEDKSSIVVEPSADQS